MAQRPRKQRVQAALVRGDWWQVDKGRLVRGRGNPGRTEPLVQVFGEKIPLTALTQIRRDVKSSGLPTDGVYFLHDSMGTVRYAGRGQVFVRIASHQRAHPREYMYFSFYTGMAKRHEKEIETLLIWAVGSEMTNNIRKTGTGTEPGRVDDFSAGAIFYERRYRYGQTPRA